MAIRLQEPFAAAVHLPVALLPVAIGADLIGLAGIGIVSYSAYVGGTLVYNHGVGVAPAGGQYREDAPALGESGQAGAFFKIAGADVVHGATHLAEEMAQGRLAPSLSVGPSAAASAGSTANV